MSGTARRLTQLKRAAKRRVARCVRTGTPRFQLLHTDRNMEMPVVLVVESEALIRMSAVHMVEDFGFAVVQACNAEEALRILDSLSDIRLVFTGINMSGSMNGLRLAHAIRDRWPPIHLIVASGRDAAARKEMPVNGRFLRKPYTAEQVKAALRELLGSDPALYRFISGANRIHGSVV